MGFGRKVKANFHPIMRLNPACVPSLRPLLVEETEILLPFSLLLQGSWL